MRLFAGHDARFGRLQGLQGLEADVLIPSDVTVQRHHDADAYSVDLY